MEGITLMKVAAPTLNEMTVESKKMAGTVGPLIRRECTVAGD